MNQYCFDISSREDAEIDTEGLKKYIERLYVGKNPPKFPEGNAPISATVYSSRDGSVCVIMSSRGKANISRMEEINKSLKPSQLKYKGLTLSKPYLYQEQTQTWFIDDMTKTCKKGDKQWKSIVQQGPYFTDLMEPYKQTGAVLTYEGKKYKLTREQEHIASFYAKRLISEAKGGTTEYLTKDPKFNANYWKDFKKYLSAEQKRVFKDFNKIGFQDLVDKLQERAAVEVDKKAKKVATEEKKKTYGYAILDGVKEKVGGFAVEPAGIFMGRGKNPLKGRIKAQIMPEDVILNLGETDPIPSPPPGHKWGGIIHDHCSQWLARWKDSLTGDPKYIRFGVEGKFKGQSDMMKYEKARKLDRHIKAVRKGYMADATRGTASKKQLGTVLYLIDQYGLRVGGEKDEEKSADTVGASTLKVGNIKLEPPSHVILDFLGKDSVQFYKKLEVPEVIYKNIASFIRGKKPKDEIFDLIDAGEINKYLKGFDADFSAKVFRTRLASVVMFEALEPLHIPKKTLQPKVKMMFKEANSKVATLLNHTRTVSTKDKERITKLEEQLKELKKELKKASSEKSKEALKKKIDKVKTAIADKNNVMNVAISTSLTNYIDPRVVVAWTKREDVTPSTVYTKALQTKFAWAIETTEADWNYMTSPLIGSQKLSPARDLPSKPSKGRAKGAPPRRTPVQKKVKLSKITDSATRRQRTVFAEQELEEDEEKPKINYPGTEAEYKIILEFCRNPTDKSKLPKVSREVFNFIYKFSKYAMSQGIKTHPNEFIVIFYENMFK